MENTMNKLANEYTSHAIFEKDQVLTKDQLNSITNFLDRQDRLSRVCLNGVGIVCGLGVSLQDGALSIARGCGVTTDGDLLSLQADATFTFCRPFQDTRALYPFFAQKEDLLLYELLPDSGDDPEAIELAGLANLDSMAVLLYLESYARDFDICTGGECDNKGQEQQNNRKALLIARADLDSLLTGWQASMPVRPQLPDAFLPRVLLDRKITTQAAVAAVFKNAVQESLDTLIPALKATCEDQFCKALLSDVYPEGDPTVAWEEILKKTAQVSGPGLQYVYDFARDLVEAYDEFREALPESTFFCCPDISLFPKHLMLGAVRPDAAVPVEQYRHGFYPAAGISNRETRLRQSRFLHQRLDVLIRSFSATVTTEEIRITPSLPPDGGLGERALPCYYAVSETNRPQEHWSFRHWQQQRTDMIPGYHAARYSDRNFTLEPLRYVHRGACFFRVEGHIGKKIDAVQARLQELISAYNLPFVVVTLQVENDIRILPFFQPRFRKLKDLRSLHYLFRRDMRYQLDNLNVFNKKINSSIQKAITDNTLPQKDVREKTVSFEGIIPAMADSLNTNISSLKQKLAVNYRQFKPTQFKTVYRNAVSESAGINNTVKGITFSTAYTPYEKVINTSRFKWVDWIDDLIKKREDTDREQALFGKFLALHPGLEHLGGVMSGGTLVLVYSSPLQTVIADFALPYICCDVFDEEETAEDFPEEEEFIPPADTGTDRPVFDVVGWNRLNDFQIHLDKSYTLADDLKLFDKKLDAVKSDLGGVQHNVGVIKTDLQTKINNVESNLNSKVTGVEGTVSTTLSQFQSNLTTLSSNVEGMTFKVGAYKDSVDTVITRKTGVLGTAATGLAGDAIADGSLSNMARMLETSSTMAAMLKNKESSGMALTDSEKAMKKQLDAIMGDAIKTGVSAISSGTTDITAGSDAEKFLNIAASSKKAISDTKVLNSLSREIKTVSTATAAANKTVLSGNLTKLIS